MQRYEIAVPNPHAKDLPFIPSTPPDISCLGGERERGMQDGVMQLLRRLHAGQLFGGNPLSTSGFLIAGSTKKHKSSCISPKRGHSDGDL